MKEKITIKLRYFRNYDHGEMYQVLMPNGDYRYIGRQMWGRLEDLYWLCDAPNGYCEHDTGVHESDYNIVWCDKDWNALGEKPLAWESQVEKSKKDFLAISHLALEDVGTAGNKVRGLWKINDHGERIVENAVYFHWKRVGKPKVCHKFTWNGYRCYILSEDRVHHHYLISYRRWYVVCAENYYALPQIVLGELTLDYVMPWAFYRRHRQKNEDFSTLSRKDGEWSLKSSWDGWSGMNFPNLATYRKWCKSHGLRPIIAGYSMGWHRVPFVVKNIERGLREMPEGFTPYPVMSNGSVYLGGYKVEGNTVLVYRPNPNWSTPWDGTFEGVNYGQPDDDYNWRAYHRFQESHVTF